MTLSRLIRSMVTAASALSLGASAAAQTAPARFDIVIAGGRVLDGSENPAYRADVGIVGDRVSAIGDLSRAPASQRIDAAGKLVAPGFIDLHSHAFEATGPSGTRSAIDDQPARLAAPNLVGQGVTTVVINQDGRSPWPLRDQSASFSRLGTGVNVLQLIGHGAVRGRVMGEDVRRAARPDEVQKMRALVRQGMQEGAFGLSSGLEYAPGRWSTTDELVALTEEVVPFRGIYISHERSDGTDPMWYWPSRDGPGAPTLLDAVSETIAIGERTGATVVASHIKAKGAHYWGTGRAAIQLIDSARARGVEVYADHYPYDTSGTDGATVLLPPWALMPAGQGIFAENQSAGPTDYAARLEAVLADPRKAADLQVDLAHEMRRRGGAEKIMVLAYPDARYVGRTLAEVSRMRGVSPAEMAILLQKEGYRDRPGGAHLRGFSMSDIDIDMFAAKNWMATASDAAIALPGENMAFVHPRFYGTFPRRIRRYALEHGALSLEDAVRSATSLPAQILGLVDRGLLRTGTIADVVVFDPNTIRDLATAQDVHKYPEGIEWVLVNGKPVVAKGTLTGARPGRVILNPKRPAAR